MTKNELMKQYQEVKDKVGLITLFIHMPDDSTEIIDNLNVQNKIEYIEKTYDGDLVHNNCKDIYITDVIFSTTDDLIDFSTAMIDISKFDMTVTRESWKSENMFIYYVPEGAYAPSTKIAKTIVNANGLVSYKPYIALKLDDNTVVPWTPTQEDILATDWKIVK